MGARAISSDVPSRVAEALATDLQVIWQKYEPQRSAERDAVATREKAAKALADLNAERIRVGLAPVGEYQSQSIYGMQAINLPAFGATSKTWRDELAKTWRNELDAELLAAVKQYCAGLE